MGVAVGRRRVQISVKTQRTLLQIPRLYTQKEFTMLISKVPKDYESTSKQFWNYIAGKLTPIMKQIDRIYHELVDQGGAHGLKMLGTHFHERQFQIIKELMSNGAILHSTEDAALVMETTSWLEMMRDAPNLVIVNDIYDESMKERNDHIANVINSTLGKGEVGIIFIIPERKIKLSKDIQTITICPFDPRDYLNRWMKQSGP